MTNLDTPEPRTRWNLRPDLGGIEWNAADAENSANTLPHADHVEMSGRRVSVIVRYCVDEQRRLFVERDIIFPQLRVRENDVRGYLRRVYDDRLILPRFLINAVEWLPARTSVDRVTFDGMLTFHYAPTKEGFAVSRTIHPASKTSDAWETWRFVSEGRQPIRLQALDRSLAEDDTGADGTYSILVSLSGDVLKDYHYVRLNVQRAEEVTAVLGFSATIDDDERVYSYEDGKTSEQTRRDFARRIQTDPAHIAFHCPDPELNQMFAFAKLRAAESLFDTDLMGLVHSPGGGNYYGGIWANDQCEYSGPFFAFLNDEGAHEAAVNAYRHYAKHMGGDYAAVPTSFEMGGHIPYRAGGDRGDAAMIASGLARYLLTRGDRALADELYPALCWCNEYNRRKTDPARGVVLSDTDELEGRFPTGDANLSTSVLAYDGYRRGADVARERGQDADAQEWDARADALAAAIESHFGATVAGYQTYRYYRENTTLRSWICLPLVFGLADGARKAGTVAALFSPELWTPDGLATEAGDTTFWDRATLYGLRGAFAADATEPAYQHLLAYSRRRLLGDHVPYPVEAYPENAQAHLSAESALYCRVFLEGLLGIVPRGFAAFDCAPRLPEAWRAAGYSVRFTAFGGRDISIAVSAGDAGGVQVAVSAPGFGCAEILGDAGAVCRVRM